MRIYKNSLVEDGEDLEKYEKYKFVIDYKQVTIFYWRNI